MGATQIRFDEVRDWLFGAALPFWAASGSGGPAGFRDTLSLAGEPGPDAVRRVRVIARQVYVFSHAALLGWGGPALERAGAGVDALIRLAWQGEDDLGEDKGWARLLDGEGAVLDARPDLYDMAFIMFALAWWKRASGDERAAVWLDRTMAFIEARMAHPSGRGFLHMLPCEPPYLQNPHMHMTETSLAAHLATGEDRWLSQAGWLVNLFRTAFFDASTGALIEVFDADWRPDGSAKARIVEPGHQLEWAWILARYGEQSGEDLTPIVRALVEAAERDGVSPRSGLVYGAVSLDGGAPPDPRHRIWPQTERIKGNLALFELTGEDRSAQIAASVDALLDLYLAPAPAGAWIDVLSENGEPMVTDITASTFYHLMLAFAELLRLEKSLKDWS